MSTVEYARRINRSPRTIQKWCSAGLIGERIGGRWEIEPDTLPPAIIPRRKIGRARRSNRLEFFKKRAVVDQQ